MIMEYALTTSDNPYSPFEDFSKWYMYDEMAGYNTCALLATFAKTSDQLSDYENSVIISNAIDRIIKLDFMNIYKKISQPLKTKIVSESNHKVWSKDSDTDISIT